MNKMDIAIRSYVKEKKNKNKWYPKKDYIFFDRVLVFDTETTIDQYQNLTFGSFKIYDKGNLEHQGLFYSEIISDEQYQTLLAFSKENNIDLMTRAQFVDVIFYPEIYELHTMCIGFNLPFDLSRLAIHFGNAKGRNKGGFSFQLSEDRIQPWITIKHLDSTKSFISFNNKKNAERGNMRHRKGSSSYRGRFLDLRTLSFSLTNKHHSLESACERFECDIEKTLSEEHGKITPEYIRYNLNDVDATYSLYLQIRKEYERYNLATPIHKIFSPASIGKAYLKKMGIRSFFEKNPDFPPKILGYIMTTYFGGRSEVRVRKKPTQVGYIDVLSMYPTVNILQGLWGYVICEKIDWIEDTQRVIELLDNLTLDTLRNPHFWKELTVICEIEPNEDILPVRAHYGDKNVFNIGINYLTSKKPLFYSLSDIIASKLLTGKVPKIKKAIRFKPNGIQNGLNEMEILNGIHFDPVTNDLFKTLIEERKQTKIKMSKTESETEKRKLDSEQHILKIITNSTSYGIFVEINTNEKKETKLEVFGTKQYETIRNKVEENGTMFNPIMGAFITSGARLILAITERILMDHGETYAFCDTDSMAVPIERVKEIQDYFKDLNPYNFDAEIFEMEKENFNENGEIEPLWFYGISAKRYVLYNLVDGKPVIRKYSSHGLGHILNPFEKTKGKQWNEQIWKDILSIEYGQNTLENILDDYKNRFAISQLTISSPEISKMMKFLNKGKDYTHQIKPFNFVIVGTARENRKHTLEDIKPLIPFTSNYHQAPYGEFIEYHSGKIMRGKRYWKAMDEVFFDYLTHPESKFDGNTGILDRKHIQVDEIIHIGKESNKLELSNVIGVTPDGYEYYDNGEIELSDDLIELLISKGPEITEKIGITQRQYYYWIDKINKDVSILVPEIVHERLSRVGN